MASSAPRRKDALPDAGGLSADLDTTIQSGQAAPHEFELRGRVGARTSRPPSG